MQKCNEFKNIAIVHVKKSAYRICFLYMSKPEAKKLMTNSNLTDKKLMICKKFIYLFIYFFFFFVVVYKKWIMQPIIKETAM